MTTAELQHCLWRFFEKRGHRAWGLNTYALGHEADFVTVTATGRASEVEIKRTRADFRADFTKTDKHALLLAAYQGRPLPPKTYGSGRTKLVVPQELPIAHFYYACPAGLIEPHEVPPYAGLLDVAPGRFADRVRVVRPAPRLTDAPLTDAQVRKLLESMMFRALRHTLGEPGETETSDPPPVRKKLTQ